MAQYTDDPIADFNAWDKAQDEELAKLPVCDECGNPIQDDYYYDIAGITLCPECMDKNYRYWTDSYVQG